MPYDVEETAEDQNVSTLLKIIGSLRTIQNEAEPELITDIRNRDQGFVLFFAFLLLLHGGGSGPWYIVIATN